MTNEITTAGVYINSRGGDHSVKKLRDDVDHNTHTFGSSAHSVVRNGEVRQISAGVRGCFRTHLLSTNRRLVQAVYRSELLFRRESFWFAVGDTEIAVCAQI